MAAALGGAATQPLVVALLAHFSWRQAFPIFGAVGVVYAAAWFAWFRDDPRAHRSVNAAEIAEIGDGPADARIPPCRGAGCCAAATWRRSARCTSARSTAGTST